MKKRLTGGNLRVVMVAAMIPLPVRMISGYFFTETTATDGNNDYACAARNQAAEGARVSEQMR